MTTQELERAAADLAVVDRALAAIPQRGRVAEAIQANRVALRETAQLVALALREARP